MAKCLTQMHRSPGSFETVMVQAVIQALGREKQSEYRFEVIEVYNKLRPVCAT